MGRMHSSLNVELTENAPLALNIETGATTVNGDFSSTQLKSLSLDSGASSISLKFGDKVASQDITLDAGASRIVLSIPKGSGVRIVTDGGLSHTDFENVDKINDTTYESQGFSSAKNQVIIHAKIGVSSFEVTRY